MTTPVVETIAPHCFEPESCFYPKALNSQLHSMVSYFFNLTHEQIARRYHHLNPQVDPQFLASLLSYQSQHFHWGGADLFYVTTEAGNRRMVILETNSCPSGQKSMPPRFDADEHRGYQTLLEQSFIPLMQKRRLPAGKLAVIYDKNYMEALGYASTLADLMNETVYLIPHFDKEKSHVIFENGVMILKKGRGEKIPIRAALRYVTQKPWNRIPIETKTFIYNSMVVCLAGGRNKLLASKAYELFNSELRDSGLKINVPQTIRDVHQLEIPLWVKKFGGYAVIKNPYSNAGQGVYTVTNAKELNRFMKLEYSYDKFIVQSLIGHYDWSSQSEQGKFFHIGTMPNKKGQIYISDLRVMVYSSPQGIFPCAIYARKAKAPLTESLNPKVNSWDVLGTNLSVKRGDNVWESDTSRLILMDRKDFNTLGIGVDDLIQAFIQTILSVIAIDKMAQNLMTSKGAFRLKLFKSLDNDESLIKEILL